MVFNLTGIVTRAVVVAQLVEWLLPTPEIRGSNQVIGKILFTNRTIEKTKIKTKRLGMAHLKKTGVVIIINRHQKVKVQHW